MKTTLFRRWVEAVKNTPPERQLKIAMQGFVLQSIGIVVASAFLIYYGAWYVIFAFLFVLLNNYSGFINAWQQHDQLIQLKKELNLPEPEDKSPHRKKVKLIKKHLGKKAGWLSAIASVGFAFLLFGNYNQWYMKVLFFSSVFVIYYILYFIVCYNIAKMKGGQNA